MSPKRRGLVLLLLVAGCGGGGGSLVGSIGSGGTGISGGVGSGGTGAPAGSVGAVSGFGSIVVNGIRFETDTSRLVLQDTDTLKLGMTVRVSGEVDAGLATGIAYEVFSAADLRGAIESVDAGGGRFTVLANDITTDRSTVYAGGIASVADLRAGDTVQVHGLPAPGGIVRATRVERLAAAAASLVLSGAVDLLDPGAASFRLGGKTVRHAGATFDAALPASALANGQLVRVRGTLAGAILEATSVEPWYAMFAADGATLSIGGLVASSAGTGALLVDGVQVDASAARITGGSPADLVAGAAVEATGTVRGGVLVAERVRVRHNAPPATEAEAFSARGPVGAFRSPADFRVRSQRVDASAAAFVGGSAADLRNGRQVLVTGSRVVDDVLLADRVEFLP